METSNYATAICRNRTPATKTTAFPSSLLAESALSRRDYPTAAQNLEAAAKINSNLSRLVRLQLRYAFDHGDADVLAKAEKTG